MLGMIFFKLTCYVCRYNLFDVDFVKISMPDDDVFYSEIFNDEMFQN